MMLTLLRQVFLAQQSSAAIDAYIKVSAFLCLLLNHFAIKYWVSL